MDGNKNNETSQWTDGIIVMMERRKPNHLRGQRIDVIHSYIKSEECKMDTKMKFASMLNPIVRGPTADTY
jgi:hypothetical protein